MWVPVENCFLKEDMFTLLIIIIIIIAISFWAPLSKISAWLFKYYYTYVFKKYEISKFLEKNWIDLKKTVMY